MIDFKNFKIKRGPSKDLHDPRLIVEEGYWYLSTDKAELFIGIIENGTPVLKPINGELIPEVNLEGYATEDFVRDAINNIPEVELYDDTELKNLINSKADKEHTHEEYSLIDHKHAEYLTEHQDLSHLALKEHEHSEYITEHQSLEHLALKEHKHDEYLTEHQSLEGYAKTADLFSKDYNDLTNKPEIPSIEGLASETYVQTEIGKINLPETDLSNYYTKEEVDALLPVEEIKEVKTKVDTVLLPKVEEEIEPTVAELKAWVDANNEIQDVILAKVGEELNILENNIGYVKVDDRSFAEVIDETFAKKVEIPSIEGLASEEFVNQKILEAELADKDIDLEAYYTKSEVDALIPDVPTKVSELENDKNYLTEHQDLSHLAAKEHTHEEYLTDLPEHTHSYNDLTDKPELFNGDYNSLTNKPEIPEAYNDYELRNLINSKAASDHTHEEYALVDHKHEEYLTKHQSLEEYAKKSELFSKDYNDLNNKPTIPSIEGLATEDYVDEAIKNIEHPANPTKVSELENDANYTNETKVLELIENNAGSKIGIDFTTDITVGHLAAGTQISKDMTIGQLLYKMLFAGAQPEEPEVPKGIVDDIITNEKTMYHLDEDGNLVEVPYNLLTFDTESIKNAPEEPGFYQVYDGDEIVESGYQHLTDGNSMYYSIAIPSELVINENVKIQTWSEARKQWMDAELGEFIGDQEEIESRFAEEDLAMPELPEGYNLWVDFSQTNPGEKLRYIIIEE